MFTGIIEATAEILAREKHRLTMTRPPSFNDIAIGSSIAIAGTCLSVVDFNEDTMTFDVVEETWKKTRLGSLKNGDVVNLERSLKVGDRFEGHVVQGHVEGVGKIVSVGKRGKIHRGLDYLRYPPSVVVQRARVMRKEPTQAEEILWQTLRGKQLNGMYFRRQRPIGKYIVDFYCEEEKLAIELDGPIHKQSREYDSDREEELSGRGVRVIRFKNEEVMTDVDAVLKRIIDVAKSPHPGPEGHPSPVSGEGQGEGALLVVQIPPELVENIAPKGSITIDGVSLTVAGIEGSIITIALIPHTLQETTLGTLKEGDLVNIETDVLIRSMIAHAH